MKFAFALLVFAVPQVASAQFGSFQDYSRGYTPSTIWSTPDYSGGFYHRGGGVSGHSMSDGAGGYWHRFSDGTTGWSTPDSFAQKHP